MEYVRVRFSSEDEPIDREVLIDDQSSGRTNEILMVQEGHHEFRLGGPDDYTPSVQEDLVQNTGADDPMIVSFTLLEEQENCAMRQAENDDTLQPR